MRIAFCILDSALLTSITWPSEMWLAAMAHNKLPDKSIDIVTVGSNNREAAQLHSIISVNPQLDLNNCGKFDLIYLPALWRNPKKSIFNNEKIVSWLRSQHQSGAAICGAGTGCCYMAEAGLLDNKPATTHWHYFDQFSKSYPNVLLQRDHFITESNNLFCAASINSLADLTIYHISNYFGKSTANHIQRHFSHEIRNPYENQTFSETSYLNHSDENILHIQLWLHENYDKQILIADIAKNSNLSERNLCRRFKKATNQSPIKYLQKIRIKNAQELLQHTNLSIEEISQQSGFYDSSHFAKLFRKYNSISPSEYKRTVRKKLFKE